MQNMSGKLSLFLTGFDFVHYNGFWSQVCESDELNFSVDFWKLKVAGAGSFSKQLPMMEVMELSLLFSFVRLRLYLHFPHINFNDLFGTIQRQFSSSARDMFFLEQRIIFRL